MPMQRAVRGLLLGVLLLLLQLTAAHAAPDVVTLAAADATLQPDGQPQRDKRVALRHRWDDEFPGVDGRATYRLALPAFEQPSPALLFERIGNQARIRVNGTLLQNFGELGNPRVDAGKASQMVIVPPALLHADRPNELEIEATMQALRGGGLSPVRYGPQQAIEALHAEHRLREQTASAAYAASMLLMGGLAAGLWWRQRDVLYGCFGLAAFFGALRHVDRIWLDVPLPWPVWGALMAIGYGCHLALIARFIILMLGRNPRWLVRAIYAVLASVVVLALLSFALRVPLLWTAGLVMLQVVGLACFAVVLREALRERRRIAWVVLGAGSLLLLAGAHDIVRVRMGLLGDATHPLAPHAMFFFVLILAGIVVERYSRSVSDYRALNDHLAERVAEREGQLNQAFEALRAQKEEQAVLSERQRIMREIHDGVGSQLVGLLNMVSRREADPAALQEHVKLALDEMRMAVDSLQPVHSDLTTVLATLRYRLQPRLQGAGVAVVWDVTPLPALAHLSPQEILQVQRILLEAFTNVLKHASATEVVMQARWLDGEDTAVMLRLSDNGVGLPRPADGEPRRGHGVPNMQARANAIGASLRVEAVPGGGTSVVLVWPVRRGSAGTSTIAVS